MKKRIIRIERVCGWIESEPIDLREINFKAMCRNLKRAHKDLCYVALLMPKSRKVDKCYSPRRLAKEG